MVYFYNACYTVSSAVQSAGDTINGSTGSRPVMEFPAPFLGFHPGISGGVPEALYVNCQPRILSRVIKYSSNLFGRFKSHLEIFQSFRKNLEFPGWGPKTNTDQVLM